MFGFLEAGKCLISQIFHLVKYFSQTVAVSEAKALLQALWNAISWSHQKHAVQGSQGEDLGVWPGLGLRPWGWLFSRPGQMAGSVTGISLLRGPRPPSLSLSLFSPLPSSPICFLVPDLKTRTF